MNLLALALLQSFSFGPTLAQPSVQAIAIAPRAAAVEAVAVAPALDAQAQLVTIASVTLTADEYPTAWPRVFEGRATGKYFGARYYSAAQGRFTSVDPAMDVGSLLGSPQGWNRYSYVENNPLRKIDPDGRQAVEALMAYTQRDVQLLAEGKITPQQYKQATEQRAAATILGAAGGALSAFGGEIVAGARALGAMAYAAWQRDPSLPGQIVEAFGPPGPTPSMAAPLVLGFRDSVKAQASGLGGRHLMDAPDWVAQFTRAVKDPKASFTLILDGMTGADANEKLRVAMGMATEAAKYGKARPSQTGWEVLQLFEAGRLGEVTLIEKGTKVKNPFL